MKRKHGYHQIFIEANGSGPWSCYGCEEPVIDLLIHHLDENPGNNDPNNLVAMHRSCHMRLHTAGKTMPPRTEEHRRRLSDALRGRPSHSQSEDTRQKISESLRGKPKPPFTEEHRRNLSKALQGRIISEETKAKMSEAHKQLYARRRSES